MVWSERRDRDEEIAKVAQGDVWVEVSRDQSHPRGKRGPAREPGRDQRDLQRAAVDEWIIRAPLIGDESRELPALPRRHVIRVDDGFLPAASMHLFAWKHRTVGASVAK